MPLPPKIKISNRKVLDLPKTPPEDRESQVHELPLDKSLNLPNGIHINNIDDAIVQHIRDKFDITSNGEPVPVYLYSQDRYFEITQHFLNTDSQDTPKLPFISVTRDPIVSKGKGLGGTFNIPTDETFVLRRDTVVVNGRPRVKVWSISQPVFVDIKYNVSIFCTKLYDVDKFNERKIQEFASRQSYVSVLGHFMPLLLEEENDNTQKDIDKRKFYHHQYNFTLMGYLIEEEKFQEADATCDIKAEILTEKSNCDFTTYTQGDCGVVYQWEFDRKNRTKAVTFNESITFDSSNTNNVQISVNNNAVSFPFNVQKGDQMALILGDGKTRILRFFGNYFYL